MEPGMEAPVEATVKAVIEAPVEATVKAGMEAPVESGMKSPVKPTMEPPVESGTETPVETAMETAVEPTPVCNGNDRAVVEALMDTGSRAIRRCGGCLGGRQQPSADADQGSDAE